MSAPRSIAVLSDYAEENWTSMDLVATMLVDEVSKKRESGVAVARICPPFRRHFGRLGHRSRTLFNADRVLNRLGHYPRFLRRIRDGFDRFHVADHSYAALVHYLPRERTGVFCHDLDLFRCLITPERAPRPFWFRAMARRVLSGLQSASVVFYSTGAVRSEIERHGLVDSARLVHAPFGVCPEFDPGPATPDPAAGIVARLGGAPFLLNVGSDVPRKRLDVLLEVFARALRRVPELRLVQVGGTWTEAHRALIARHGIGQRVMQLRGIERRVLASLYRQAAVVLMPTEAEGFGLPLLEALACGSSVVASDLVVLREVGGDAALYRPVGDVEAWANTVEGVLLGTVQVPSPAQRLHRAERYSWSRHADTILGAYGLTESSRAAISQSKGSRAA
jgi:glycosyltransferase involved in cell wall biosynthesis